MVGVQFAAACSGGGASSSSSSGYCAGVPAEFLNAQRASIAETAPVVVVRDASATLVAYCLSRTGFETEPGRLFVGGDEVHAIGGTYSEDPARRSAVQYVIYPPTVARQLTVTTKDGLDISVTFDDAPTGEPCGAQPAGRVEFLACASLVLVEWSTDWRVQGSISAVRGYVEDVDHPSTVLGFHVISARPAAGGLTIIFSFSRPVGSKVEFVVQDAVVDGVTATPPSPQGFIVEVPAAARVAR